VGRIASLIALVKRNVETLDELVRRHGAAEVVEDYEYVSPLDAGGDTDADRRRADIQTCPPPWLNTAS